MKKHKKLNFDEVMDLYDKLFPKGKEVRSDPRLKAATPGTIAERLRASLKLSEQLIWKKPSKR